MEIKITKADETKQAKREIIDYNNEEGWLTYKNHSDEIADVIKKIALNRELNIDEVREKIRATDEMIQKRALGPNGLDQRNKKGLKKDP